MIRQKLLHSLRPNGATRVLSARHGPHGIRLQTTAAPGNVDGGALVTRDRDPFWQKVEPWKNVTESEFLSYQWQCSKTIGTPAKLQEFLAKVLPDKIPRPSGTDPRLEHIATRHAFLRHVEESRKVASMAVRITPYILSVVNWTDPLNDPILRQFVTPKSIRVPDHPQLALDSLHEMKDSPVDGLVHRYPHKVLFLAVAVCPVYCCYCTRSYAVGGHTDSVEKATTMKPLRTRWDAVFNYIEETPAVHDVVVSGGDSYYLDALQLRNIGERLLSIPHVKRFRFATRGPSACPVRLLEHSSYSDGWTEALIELSNKGVSMNKEVALHTHFNHPNEITWITELAARRLFKERVRVRNQTVLLRGVNDDVGTMSTLIRSLADMNIAPYYVYQLDTNPGNEHLRTPLSVILHLEEHIRGTIAGFQTPNFVVDLPGGGGKRLANSYKSYDEETGVSTFKAPGVARDQVFKYYDPIRR